MYILIKNFNETRQIPVKCGEKQNIRPQKGERKEGRH
jgi:hypothetical protein